jgi:hypothetical protein
VGLFDIAVTCAYGLSSTETHDLRLVRVLGYLTLAGHAVRNRPEPGREGKNLIG